MSIKVSPLQLILAVALTSPVKQVLPVFLLQLGLTNQFNGGTYDAFVAKFSVDGSSLIYATFIGGDNDDWGNDIVVDSSGNAYIIGQTASNNFPATTGDTTYNGGTFDVFVAKLSANGSSLSYATYLGGSNEDVGNDIVVDISGLVYVTGQTVSADFPASTGDKTFNGGSYDAFIAKLSRMVQL